MSRAGVTIAIPNWNHELCLPRSISSALAAVRSLRAEGCPAEVLVVDDQSRDGSLTLLRQLEAFHFREGLRVLALIDNRGLAASRNVALEHARYRYLVFLDADNELVPDNVPCLWQALRQTGAAAAYGNLFKKTDSSPDPLGLISNESFQDRILKENYIDALAMFDGDQLRDLGLYDKMFNPHEDYEMWLRLADNGRRVLFVPVAFGYYYVLPGSMNTNPTLGVEVDCKIRRVHDQLGAKQHLPCNTRHLRYHPAVGYC